ncbi:phospho-N-acetylmuramoyl-pentapeptide-transferase [Psychrilyobacter sp.]|uniref:phospho-N-acetylmuramoyl-pentapeptide- transferase n=1 Tax=Psychrilyobacter sp. TaxID=2586924 RepID=UPI003019BDE7
MLYYLAENYEKLTYLKSIYLRGFLGFAVSLMIVMILGKPFIAYLRRKKIGDEAKDVGPETHFKKAGTPTMGGVLIVFSATITNLIVGNLSNKFNLMLLLCMLLFSSIGFLDDYRKLTVCKKGLSGRKKMIGQALIAVLTWLFVIKFEISGTELDFGIMNPFSKNYLYIGAVPLLGWILLVLIGSSNAVNITDGLDGLVIMPVIIAASILGLIAYFTGHIELSQHFDLYYIAGTGEITVFLTGLIGAGLGFLWFNFYPAEIFMGDTGSLMLGGLLGVIAIFLKQELLFLLIGFVFVVEAVSVILQVGSYKMRKKRIFRMAPIHHHFELQGLAETKVTIRFWIIGLLCGIGSLIILKLR